MEDNIKAVAAGAIDGISNVQGDITNDEVLKGMIMALLFVCKEVAVERDSFFAGLNKAWDMMAINEGDEA